jgi:alkanesulfonate monooxygenase SsuD/methylene tetrahydromethanopterin reductase-like flavin-dependent oxidoreductase (luciferase family)
VSTLDVLSGGRAVLGLGAAWYEREHAAYGVPFPPLRERF